MRQVRADGLLIPEVTDVYVLAAARARAIPRVACGGHGMHEEEV
jgi:hypothetical protein